MMSDRKTSERIASDRNIAIKFTGGILREALAIGAVIGDAAGLVHRATYKSATWLINNDRKALRYVRQLGCEAEARSEEAAEVLRASWIGVAPRTGC